MWICEGGIKRFNWKPKLVSAHHASYLKPTRSNQGTCIQDWTQSVLFFFITSMGSGYSVMSDAGH